MKERPILFSGAMVRAILDRRKTQTRRVVVPSRYMLRYTQEKHGGFSSVSQGNEAAANAAQSHLALGHVDRLPYGQVGDRLWVRETHALVPRTAYARSDGVQQTLCPTEDHDAAVYREGWDRSHGGLRWRPSIHMPRWASRISLEIVGVRVERIQDIGGLDALAEGVERHGDYYVGGPHPKVAGRRKVFTLAWQAYKDIWNNLNEKRGYGWDVNPWVWVIEFKRIEA